MKINRKQLRKIISEAIKLGTGDRSEVYTEPGHPEDDDMGLRYMGKTPYSLDDSSDIMDMGSRSIDIDYETGIGELPAEDEEDVGEMARYHALNSDRDETLYRDNPDYRDAYDSMNESMVDEGFFGSFFGGKKTAEDEKKARARDTLRRLKSGEISVKDVGRNKPDDLEDIRSGIDQMMADLGYDPRDETESGGETREEKLARLKKQVAINRAKGRAAFQNLQKSGYFQGKRISENKKKKSEEDSAFLRWYFGNDPEYKADGEWHEFGGNYHNLSLNQLFTEEEDEEDKKEKKNK